MTGSAKQSILQRKESVDCFELLMQKVEKRLRDKGITQTRLPPPKIMLPLIEHATMEYEDDLHTLWANLLGTALNAAGNQVHRKYVSTFAELSTDDARALEAIFREWQKVDKDKWSQGGRFLRAKC